MTAIATQFARFLCVGVGNTLISFAAYLLLLVAGTPAALAAALAFAAGAVNGYVFNRRWTFAAADSTRARAVYVVVQAAGALATSGGVWLLVHEASVGRIGAYAAAVPPVTVATFVANRGWTFRSGSTRSRCDQAAAPSSLETRPSRRSRSPLSAITVSLSRRSTRLVSFR